MGSGKETSNFTAEDFDLTRVATYTLIIDATVGEEPVLAFFDAESRLLSLTGLSGFGQQYGKDSLSALKPGQVKWLVPAIDSQLIPEHLYDSGQREQYAKLVLDDGVAPLRETGLPEAGAVLLYREYLPSLSALGGLFSKENRVVFPAAFIGLMTHHLTAAAPENVFGIHLAHEFYTFCISRQGSVLYFREFQLNDIDDFNYHFINALSLFPENSGDLKMVLSGNIRPDDPYHGRISRYSTDIQFADIYHAYHRWPA